MAKAPRYWLRGLCLTLALYLLVSFAISDTFDIFFFVMLGALVASVSLFYWLFPGSHFTTVALANFLSIYACLFVFFVDANFAPASSWTVRFAFLLPILAFIGGVGLRRHSIRSLVRHEVGGRERYSPRVFMWLVPVMGVGVLSFLLPHREFDRGAIDLLLLASMGFIAAVVLAVSRDVTAFLLDTGLLFEEFFDQAGLLLAPTLAFFTYYTFVIVVFGSIYRLIEKLIPGPHFLIAGGPGDVTFLDAIYFSIITLSTVGYGDVTPASSLVRAIASLEIVIGVWLIIFGFSEVLRYVRERDLREQRRHGHH